MRISLSLKRIIIFISRRKDSRQELFVNLVLSNTYSLMLKQVPKIFGLLLHERRHPHMNISNYAAITIFATIYVEQYKCVYFPVLVIINLNMSDTS